MSVRPPPTVDPPAASEDEDEEAPGALARERPEDAAEGALMTDRKGERKCTCMHERAPRRVHSPYERRRRVTLTTHTQRSPCAGPFLRVPRPPRTRRLIIRTPPRYVLVRPTFSRLRVSARVCALACWCRVRRGPSPVAGRRGRPTPPATTGNGHRNGRRAGGPGDEWRMQRTMVHMYASL